MFVGNIFGLVLVTVAVCSFLPTVMSQDGQRIQLTYEMVAEIKQVLSTQCADEFDEAINGRAEPTDECRDEIQQAVQTVATSEQFINVQQEQFQQQQQQQRQQQRRPPPDAMRNQKDENDDDDDDDDEKSEGSKAKKETTLLGVLTHPGTSIAMFVALLIGLAGAAAYYINSELSRHGVNVVKPPKKLSKKKEEKLRSKASKDLPMIN